MQYHFLIVPLECKVISLHLILFNLFPFKKNILVITLSIVAFLNFSVSKAQVTANFSGTPLIGCSPLIVNFTDLSTGSVTTWNWNLGNGSPSTLQNPSGVYSLPGVYSVTLTVSDGSSTNTIVKTNYITVYNKPTANFTLNSDTVCIGQTITYTDASVTFGGPPIASWGWDFGDGNTATTTTGSTTHAYTAAGNYPVSLIISDPNGCGSSVIHTVVVIAPPNASFTASPIFKCTPPLNVIFTNTSSSSSGTTYSWNFGDGGTSNQLNPTHTYTASGTYNVTLILNQNGCIDSVVVPSNIIIQNITPSFVPTPSVVCSGQPVTFTNTSTPIATTSNWTFGDGGTSTSISPVHTYTAAGTYTINLSATDGNGCSGNTTGTVTVNQSPVAAFVADTMVACSAPFTVNFTDNSIGGSTYSWNFGDGNTSTSQNPTNIYTSPGTYTVTIIVTNSTGTCSNTIVKNSYIIICH